MAPSKPLHAIGYAVGVVALAASTSAVAQPAEPRPDLIVSTLELSHAELAPDSVVGVSFTVENRGAADAPQFRIAVYHSDGLVVPKRGNVTRIAATHAFEGLKAGGKATFTLPARIPPCDKCKPGNIYAFADAWGTVLETSEDNNFRAVPVQIDPKSLPNLRVEQLALEPDRGAMGNQVRVRGVIRNATAYRLFAPIRLGVYCSEDMELDGEDLLLATWMQPAFPATGTLAIDRKVKVDTRCAVRGQNVQLGLRADVDRVVPESDENDNGALAPYWVFKSPDLSPGQIALSRSDGPAGSKVVVSYRVRNEGKTAAVPFDVGIYLSKDAAVSTEDQLLERLRVDGLAAGASSGTLNQVITVPGLPAGGYHLGVIVDAAGTNGELRERNNMKAMPFAIRRVNLTDKYFFVDKSSAAPGEQLELRFALRNTADDAAAAFKVAFFYSEDPRWDAKDQRLADFDLKKLGKGAEPGDHVLSVQLPATAAEGYRFVLMVTDETDAVAELDEYDNVALRPVRIARK